MKKALFVVPLLVWAVVLIGAPAAQSQVAGGFAGVTQCWNGSSWVTVHGNCPATGGGGGGSNPSGANSAAYNNLNQAGYQLGYALGRWLFGSNSNPQAELQKQQMLEELQRRQAEAERLHQEEEARRLAAMYNRLLATLKLNGLPNLQLKQVGANNPGLSLKLGDSPDGHVGVKGLPGMYLNDGATPYGIPGLPGIYTGGPGPGSGLTNSKLALKTGDGDTSAAQPASVPAAPNASQQPYGAPADSASIPAPVPANDSGPQFSGLQLKTGDGAGPAAQATTPGPGLDPSKMTPQQLADAAEQFSKLPPEDQQRIMTAAQNDNAASQPNPGATTQPSAMASLQQQAAASQSAAAAPDLESASAGARAGFDTPLGPSAIQPVTLSSSSQPTSVPSQTPPSAATVYHDRTANSAARPNLTVPPARITQPTMSAPPTATAYAAARPSPSPNPASLSTPPPSAPRYVETVDQCLARYMHTGPSGAAPSLDQLQTKLEREHAALEKLLETQKDANEDRNEWLKEMRKAAQDASLMAIDKGVDGLFESTKEGLKDAEVELHEAIQNTDQEAGALRQEIVEARNAAVAGKADPERMAALNQQWNDMETNQIQPLLERHKALEDQWESTFKWKSKVDGFNRSRDFGIWLTDMELPCTLDDNHHLTCKNFKDNNAYTKMKGGDQETTLDGLKQVLSIAAHNAESLKQISNYAVIGTTAGKLAANATFIGETWDATSMTIDLTYDGTVGVLGFMRLRQVKQNDAQFEIAKSKLGALIDRTNAEASCYRNAH
ncbi:MAG: hypothetical protein ACLPLR_17100 [Terriglobales bacterium]